MGFKMNKLIFTFALLAVGCLTREPPWDWDEEVLGAPEVETAADLGEEPIELPKPPNSPPVACRRALSKRYEPISWTGSQFLNWCYFNDTRKGGQMKDYKTWPRVPNWSKTGTVVIGKSTAGYNHLGIICGGIFCHVPNNPQRPVVCRPVNQVMRWLFRSYTLHYPPDY
eukprot:TRINITY_DN1068_c0_g1_i10.p1 TRINITY_DN1068_c0_g1~~TRINITY_DN1068_c0_g1_i10.p1  ORF type:complete len:169 (+),score=1.42 TRINITY_DN1068_c0_g1_i10:35-541(+)